MRFRDPQHCRCDACGVESMLPVQALLSLEARCPVCGSFFREMGLGMRRNMDEVSTFFNAIKLVLQLRDRLGIEIPIEEMEEITTRDGITLQDLVDFIARHAAAASPPCNFDGRAEMLAAIQIEQPKAEQNPDFNIPLLDALYPDRSYSA